MRIVPSPELRHVGFREVRLGAVDTKVRRDLCHARTADKPDVTVLVEADVAMPAACLVHIHLVELETRGWSGLDWSALALLAGVEAGR